MGNVIDYLNEYGNETFSERAFSAEDALALAQLSYLRFDGFVSGLFKERDFIFLGQLLHAAGEEEMFRDILFPEENRALYMAACKSRRFGTIKIGNYVNQIDQKGPSQFSAVTYLLEDGIVYVAFRGTDETLAGWREDFEMACRMPVKSQELSVRYLNLTVRKLPEEYALEKETAEKKKNLLIGGHSKGGNLAVYAALSCKEEIRRRIRCVYNLDGPGFLLGVWKSKREAESSLSIRKIIPQASVVGMLFEDFGAYEVVKSSSHGVMQHNAFSWCIEDGHLEKAGEVYQGFQMAGEILNKWLSSLSEEQLAFFTSQLFGLFDEAEVKTIQDLGVQWRKLLVVSAQFFSETDRKTYRALWKIGRAFLAAAKQTLGVSSMTGERGERRK